VLSLNKVRIRLTFRTKWSRRTRSIRVSIPSIKQGSSENLETVAGTEFLAIGEVSRRFFWHQSCKVDRHSPSAL